ncbi:hypothetical protein HMPREF0973_01622 [Prevotella veroralis F0319]|uniref:Uncharacterized protein n=1 Tax=Prevotella veroralis F0319 TaxID=649761 RepID=C9MPT2_9BACT|nr:hypothetical protein HMPREF0973_01622 [Prevotella veroralis F0319]
MKQLELIARFIQQCRDRRPRLSEKRTYDLLGNKIQKRTDGGVCPY